jgi:peptide/nickel transport system ATP-binding protein/oligopeptide transport system ATP-binding protein
MMRPVLSVSHLTTTFRLGREDVPAVDDVSLEIAPGEVLGVVGESGSGKSVLALSIMGLLPTPPGRIAQGSIKFDGQELVGLPARELRKLRGGGMGMIFQEPMSSLNPVFTVGDQVIEAVRAHRSIGKAQARREAIDMLARVGIPSPDKRLDAFPHQLSGGMRQRVMIAMALAGSPRLLIADEPTTALDVTIQAQILDLLLDLRADTGAAILLITHNMGVIAETADRVMVMYAGRVAEQGAAADLFDTPAHPYTLGLMGSTPVLAQESARLTAIPGSLPRLGEAPPGCRFAPRCPRAVPECTAGRPPLVRLARPDHAAACIRAVTP